MCIRDRGDGLDPEDVFVGIGTTIRNQSLVYFTGIGTGVHHSLKLAYDDTVKGSIERNKITVATASSHGLEHNDRVFLTVNAGITTTVPIKYNAANRKLVARTLDFYSAGVSTSVVTSGIPDAIEILGHEMVTGQRVIHTLSLIHI